MRKKHYTIIDRSIESDPNGAYLQGYRSYILKNQWPRKHTEHTEYPQKTSVPSVDSVAIYHDFDLSKRHWCLIPLILDPPWRIAQE
jgi:hypothetical protein